MYTCMYVRMYVWAYVCMYVCMLHRLGKLACPRVNDDQKIAADYKKLNSGRPHDDQLISGYSLIHLG